MADVVTAELWIDNKRFADTAAAWYAGDPVALADLELIWGRETTVDQPDTSTLTFRIVDRAGGKGLLDVVEIGKPVRVWARGNISPTYGGNFNTQIDGGFETAPLGDPGNRVHVWNSTDAPTSSSSIVAGSPDNIGARVLHFKTSQINDIINIPPAAFDDGAADAWLTLPFYNTGATWQLTAQLRVGKGMTVMFRGRTFTGPNQRQGQKYAGSGLSVVGTGAWQFVSTSTTGTAQDVDDWLGTSIRAVSWQPWSSSSGTWAGQPAGDRWDTYSNVDVDRVTVLAPAAAAVRGVMAFAGRISDLRLTRSGPDEWAADCTAVDLLADLANLYIGDEPWPAEGVFNRINRIYAAAGITGRIQLVMDETIHEHTTSWRDVDHQSTSALIVEQAAAIDFVCWPASASTIKPYIWLEDPALRAQVGELELDSAGFVVISPGSSSRIGGKTSLDGCDLLADDVAFVRDVTDVVSIVDASWLEQTLEDGLPAPTERTVTVRDEPAIAAAGERRLGIGTMTTAAAEASSIAAGILARTRQAQWRTEGLAWDLNLTPPPRGSKTAQVLDLLDGTIRLGRGLVVDDVDWPGSSTTIAAYLDGGRYVYDGAWRLELHTTPTGGFGVSAAWDELDAAWDWDDFEPSLAWVDLWGVAGPAALELEPTR